MCYCRQPSGGVIGLPHSSWVTLISQDLVAASAKNVNPMVAEAVSEGPISIYTEMRIYYCTYNSFVCINGNNLHLFAIKYCKKWRKNDTYLPKI